MNLRLFNQLATTSLIVGTLDGMAASLHTYLKTGRSPEIVFRYVASGVFGAEAFTGGAGMIALGLLFHYLIATGWSVLYVFIHPYFKITGNRPWINGPLYGLYIWLMMQFLILPMSNVRPISPTVEGVVIGILIHMIVIGLTLALVTHQYEKKSPG